VFNIDHFSTAEQIADVV